MSNTVTWTIRFDCALGWEDVRICGVRKDLQLPKCCASAIEFGPVILPGPIECTVAPMNFTFAARICDPTKRGGSLLRGPVSFAKLVHATTTSTSTIVSIIRKRI